MNKPINTLSRSKLFKALSLLCLLLVVHMIFSLANRDELDSALLDDQTRMISSVSGYTDKPLYKADYRFQSYASELGQQHKSNKEFSHIATSESSIEHSTTQDVEVSVFITEDQRVELVPLEHYVYRVALAELPLSFSEEAIKAQMLAIRTYIIHRMQNESNLIQNESSGESYWVTDTKQHQVFMSERRLQELNDNENYAKQLEKFEQAVAATSDKIIVYQQQPIEAVFFSTSNGYTEAAEDYWGNQVEYLQSVPSKWDTEISPSYKQSITYTYEQVYTRLNLLSDAYMKPEFSKKSYTDSKRLASVQINKVVFTGKELREKLELASTHIWWEIDDKEQQITFSTYGYGHGVGLSQWGANGMAQEGYLAEEIIKHYYQGVSIEQASKLVKID